jgi:hypothetical protein
VRCHISNKHSIKRKNESKVAAFGSVLSVCLWTYRLGDDEAGGEGFRQLVAVAAFTLWVKFTGYIKTFSMQLATFVLAVGSMFNKESTTVLVLIVQALAGVPRIIYLSSWHGIIHCS